MKPVVSILIPAYNAAEWITDTVRSALAQTWDAKEVIIVDDGSSDATLARARCFEDRGVTVVTQPNAGAAAARNKAFALSRGDYIQWLDADDLLAPDKIAKQMELVEQGATTRTLLSGAWGRFRYRPHRATFTATSLWADLTPVEWLTRKLRDGAFMQTGTWLVSRELCEAAGEWNPEMRVDDDGEYFCRVLLQSDGIRFAPESKLYYRTSGGGRLSYIGYSDEKQDAMFRSMQLHIDYLRTLEDSPRTRAACLKYLEDNLLTFHPGRPDLVAKLQLLAEELGGKLGEPRFAWKYAWIEKLLGSTAAKRTALSYNAVKCDLLSSWDWMLSRWDGHHRTGAAGRLQ